MKKIMIFLIVGVLAISAAACSDKTDETAAPETNQTQQYATPTGPFSEADMVFVNNGAGYPISTDVTPLLNLFGEGYEVIAAPSCAFTGEDKQFIYDFATIYTYPMDGIDMINEIYIYGGEYTTSRGIGIGATLDEVKAAYGDTGFQEGNSYVYVVSGTMENTSSPKLYFELTDGVVSGISYFGANGIIQ